MNTNDRLTALMVSLGEVAVDVKHLLVKHDEISARMDRMEDRTTTTSVELGRRIRVIEGMRNRLLGIAFIVPIVLSIAVFYLGRINNG